MPARLLAAAGPPPSPPCPTPSCHSSPSPRAIPQPSTPAHHEHAPDQGGADKRRHRHVVLAGAAVPAGAGGGCAAEQQSIMQHSWHRWPLLCSHPGGGWGCTSSRCPAMYSAQAGQQPQHWASQAGAVAACSTAWVQRRRGSSHPQRSTVRVHCSAARRHALALEQHHGVGDALADEAAHDAGCGRAGQRAAGKRACSCRQRVPSPQAWMQLRWALHCGPAPCPAAAFQQQQQSNRAQTAAAALQRSTGPGSQLAPTQRVLQAQLDVGGCAVRHPPLAVRQALLEHRAGQAAQVALQARHCATAGAQERAGIRGGVRAKMRGSMRHAQAHRQLWQPCSSTVAAAAHRPRSSCGRGVPRARSA